MEVTEQSVRQIFELLERGDSNAFFQHVADEVDWTVMGTHPLAGHYRNKADFIAGTFAKLAPLLPSGAQLQVRHLHVAGNQATVELQSMATARNGMRFDNRYCWVVCFDNNRIVKVRAYLDSAMVATLFAQQNPSSP
jgi:ketosteroid isomerase-like protein